MLCQYLKCHICFHEWSNVFVWTDLCIHVWVRVLGFSMVNESSCIFIVHILCHKVLCCLHFKISYVSIICMHAMYLTDYFDDERPFCTLT